MMLGYLPQYLTPQLSHGTDPKEQENIPIINSLHLKSKFAKKVVSCKQLTSLRNV